MEKSSTTPTKLTQSTQGKTAGSGNAAPPTGDAPAPAAARKTAAPAPVRRRPIDLIEGAKRQLKELTGYPVDSVAGFAGSDKGWALTVTVIALQRIPAATDVLAEYLVDLDASGDIVSYRRGRRFHRGDVGEAE